MLGLSKLERLLSNVDAHNVFVLLSGACDRLTLVYARCSRSQRIFNACTLPYKAISGAHVVGSEFIETEQTFVERAQRGNATKHKFLLVVKKTETHGILSIFVRVFYMKFVWRSFFHLWWWYTRFRATDATRQSGENSRVYVPSAYIYRSVTANCPA